MLEHHTQCIKAEIAPRQISTPAGPFNRSVAAAESNSLADHLMTRHAPTRTFMARETLFVEGDLVESLFQIRSGTVRCCLFAEDGRRLITRFATVGDFLGLASGARFSYTAEAVDTVTLASCPRAVVDAEIGRNGQLCHDMRRLVSMELTASRSLMMTHMRMVATERVVWFLRNFADIAGSGAGGYTCLPMTRLDIADHLGLTIETVSRTFSALKADGWIDMPSSKTYCLIEADELGELPAAA